MAKVVVAHEQEIADLIEQADYLPLKTISHQEESLKDHMDMCVKEMKRISRREFLDIREIDLMHVAAIFHDIGKVKIDLSTDDSRKKNHADISAKIAFKYFKQTGHMVTGVFLHALYYLIKFHHLPFTKFLNDAEKKKAYLSAGYTLPMDYLYYLCEANIFGRESKQTELMLRDLIKFRDDCINYGTWYNRYPFKNDYTKFLYFNRGNILSHEEIKDGSVATCHLLTAVPGSNMEDWAAANRPNLPVISPMLMKGQKDLIGGSHIHTKDLMNNIARSYARQSKDFVWCCYDLRKDGRSRIINYLHTLGIKTDIVYIDKPLKTILADCPDKEHAIIAALGHYEPPTPTECWGFSRVEK